MKLIVTATAFATLVAAPVLASPLLNADNSAVFKYPVTASQNDKTTWRHSGVPVFKYPATAPLNDLYDSAASTFSGLNRDSPELTGGGSSGYNESVRKDSY